MKKFIKGVSILIVLALLIGLPFCGKPPAPRGRPEGGPATAVVGKVEKQVVEEVVDLVGSLKAKQEITLIAELDAELEGIGFVEGESVEQGQTLFVFDQIATQARLEEAEAGFKLAQLTFDRSKDLLKKEVISQEEYDRAESDFMDRTAGLSLARDTFNNTEIKAPFSGLIGERYFNSGQFVSKGSVLAELVSIDDLEAVFAVPERYLPRLAQGLPVTFESNVYEDQLFSGAVSFIAPRIDEQSRTILLKAKINNESGLLRPGQFGQLRLVLSINSEALVIPESAVILKGLEASVIVVTEAGVADFRTVILGQRLNKKVEVKEGLSLGEQLVVEGVQKVFFPGMPILAAPESAHYGVEPSTPPEEPSEIESNEG